MAYIRIISCLLISSLISEAKSENNFVTIACQKSEIVAQYGTSTLLDCVVQPLNNDATIEIVTWKFNKTPVLNYYEGIRPSNDASFQFAKSSWDHSNMNVSLLITNTSLSQAGEYHCNVMTDSGNAETKVHLTVKSNYSKPIIYSDPEKITPDKEFTLTCKAHGGFPKGEIRWVVNDDKWKNNPELKFEITHNGLYDLTSKLSFGPHSPFTKFTCEVYNANGVKEDQKTFHNLAVDLMTGSDTKGHSVTQIVAPVVVIGSLIVGLLAAVLLCRRRQKARRLSEAPLMNVPVVSSEENVQMV